MNPSAVIFDFDGVLAESVDVKTRAFAKLYEPYGSKVVKAVTEFHLLNGGMTRFEKFSYYHRKLLKKQLSKKEETALGEAFSRIACKEVVQAPMVLGAMEFIQKHRNVYKLHVASGTPDGELNFILKERRLYHFFISVHGSPLSKTEIITNIINQYGYQAKEVVMIGDSLSDFIGAHESGVNFIGRVKPNGHNPFPAGIMTISDLIVLSKAIERI